ncbi:alpha/beta hydrolase [Actinoplanes sp. NPDC049265]|uniref:alpha/beta hydrolase n=1 Tax=Actinoplanes sp. NPDC049265 TaxID=3363902 RepID=UPI00371DCC95
MPPDSLALEIVVAAVAVTAPVGAGLVRTRLVRALALALCLLSAAATALVWLNRQVDAYPTWATLTGSSAEAAPVTATTTPGGGRILDLTVPGHASGLTLPMYAYLPPGYDTATRTSYPVVEALHGYPASPLQWLKRLHVAKTLDTEITAGRMAPTIVLFPWQTTRTSLDTECTNLSGGPQAETFLTVDVPAFAKTRLRVRTTPGSWGLIGYSAGGYCATDLLLRHPGQYRAAAGLSSYATPGIKVGDGSERTTYNDCWRLTHLPVPAVALYLASSPADRNSSRDTAALARLARAPMTVTTTRMAGGGHNLATWEAMEAPAFDWLSTWLSRPER